MTESFSETRSQVFGWAQKTLPILVSILILYYYFRGQNWSGLFSAASHANLSLAVIAVIFPQLAVWVTNALLTSWTITWFYGPFSFWKFFWVRGAIFMLQLINNPLGAGGTLFYIKHKTKIEWPHLLGIMAFRFQMILWSICLMMLPFTFFTLISESGERFGLYIWGWWIFLVFQMVFFIVVWNYWHHDTDPFRLGKFIVRDRENAFWTAFQQAEPKHWFQIIAISLPEMFVIFLGYYIMALAFDVQIPFWECLMKLPFVLFISNLPIAFGGFGTTTAAWVFFFGDYGTEGNLIALTIFIPFTRALFRSVVGLIALKPSLDELATLSFFSPVKNMEEPPAAPAN